MIAFKRNKLDVDITVARDGVSALEMLHGTAEKDPMPLPAVVLLDLQLPKVDGHEVLRRIRETPATSLLPVVILTSSLHERDRLQTYKTGANSYIVKPVDFEKFVDAAGVIGKYWTRMNYPPPWVAAG